MLLSIFDTIDAVIYISDIENYNLIYLNKAGRKLLGIDENCECLDKCYKTLQGLSSPCPFCNMEKLKIKGMDHWERTNREDRYYVIYDHLITYEGSPSRLEIALDISEKQNQTQKALKDLKAEENIVECVQRLTSADDVDSAIMMVLETILTFYRGNRAYIFEFDWSNNEANNTYEYCAEGVTAEIDNLKGINLENPLGVWMKYFCRGESVYIEDMNKLGADRKEEYEVLSAQGIRALMAVPFYLEDRLAGFLGVDDPKIFSDDPRFLVHLTYFISSEMAKRRLQNKLIHLSYHDVLTGLYNRNRYIVYQEKFNLCLPSTVGVAFMDMNGLKVMNDTMGHAYGDTIIQQVAHTIKHYFSEAHCFRLSGDEFLVVLENCDEKNFVKQIEGIECEFEEESERVVTCGWIWEDRVSDLQSLVNRADQLMYVNKQRYYADHLATTSKKPRLLKGLLTALETTCFKVYLQPKALLENLEVFSAEALVRYDDPEYGIIPPARFIPLLEKERIIPYVDFYVLEQVCTLLKRWKEEGRRKLFISTNFSRITMMKEFFVEQIIEICDRNHIEHDQIEVEITETAETIDQKHLQDALDKLRSRGFRVALDDFGSAYSSMNMLVHMEMDVLKIDMSLIRKIEENNKSKISVQHIIEAGHAMGLHCLAEGVENENIIKILKRMGCDSIQGYYISRPLPIALFEEKYM